jgi:two-component system, cell cycle sensor histidine kinase and response regulator CckA
LDTLGQARSDLIGRTLTELSADETSKAAEYLQGSFERARLEGPQLFESSLRRANGETVQVEVVLKCSHIGGQGRILAVARDISERKNSEALQKNLQEQLIQAGKLDSIGRLAGGVAHDFNNLLTVILGHLYLVLEKVPAEQKDLRRSLEEVGKAANRASELTRQLLAFSRKQMLQMRQLDLNESIVGVGRMLQRLIGEDIEVSTVLNPAIRPLRADPTQIEQVIMNLAINARDAMPNGGRLTIQTSGVTLDESYAVAHPDSRPGTYVLLTVSDTGCGMDLETQKRVFEPFFTTKGIGKGTGLGLATVHGIVKQHGGYINFESKPGEGTTFRILLPALPKDEGPLPDAAKPDPLPRGSETILVVEDEPGIRRLSCQLLTSQGYQVLEAKDAADAIRLAREGSSIDLLFTDVVMPQMSGRQVFDQIAVFRPGLKALYASGYTEDVIAHHGVLDPTIHFLQKPYSCGALARKVREALTTNPEA